MAKIKGRHKERSDATSLSTHRSRQFDSMVCQARLSPSPELVGVHKKSAACSTFGWTDERTFREPVVSFNRVFNDMNFARTATRHPVRIFRRVSIAEVKFCMYALVTSMHVREHSHDCSYMTWRRGTCVRNSGKQGPQFLYALHLTVYVPGMWFDSNSYRDTITPNTCARFRRLRSVMAEPAHAAAHAAPRRSKVERNARRTLHPLMTWMTQNSSAFRKNSLKNGPSDDGVHTPAFGSSTQ